MDANGSGLVQAEAKVEDGAGELPPGSHPPFTQTQAGPGFAVEHELEPPPLPGPPGIHPPLVQVPPPIDAKGSGVVHPPEEADPPPDVGGSHPPFTHAQPGPGAAELQPPVEPPPPDLPGTHPPLAQVPPPIDANGSAVVHPPVEPEPPPDVGGIHPPFTHVQPAPGEDVAQPPAEPPPPEPPPDPPGTQPPLTQVPPPMEAKGSAVAHPPVGGVGGVGDVGVQGVPPPVDEVAIAWLPGPRKSRV